MVCKNAKNNLKNGMNRLKIENQSQSIILIILDLRKTK